MGMRHSPREAEAQTKARVAAALVAAYKTVEYPVLIRRGDADTGITHRNPDPFPIRLERNHDLAIGFGELDSIIYEIGERPLEML